MHARKIDIDIPGLDLLLGGGVYLLKRAQELDESTTILFRGPAGAGKTLFAVQLADSIARTLHVDVAYGCIELLPSELAAQHVGILGNSAPERVVPFEVDPSTGSGSFPKHPKESNECRIFAASLDIGGDDEEQVRLVPAVQGLLEEVERAGGRPRVMVLDSLSDGYNLGTKAPRRLADELCKMAAERGMILILLEEIVDSRPSVWSFATDVVMELGTSSEPTTNTRADRAARWILVLKNRLGPSHPGEHPFHIVSGRGINVTPQPWVYSLEQTRQVLFAGLEDKRAGEHAWLKDWTEPAGWPSLRGSVVAVSGPLAHAVYMAALQLGDTAWEGLDVMLSFGSSENYSFPRAERIGCANPFLSGSSLLASATRKLREIYRRGQSVRRILVGDLHVVRTFRDPDGVRRACMVLASLARSLSIPIIFFEFEPTASKQYNPQVYDFANVTVSASGGRPGETLQLTLDDLRTGTISRPSVTVPH